MEEARDGPAVARSVLRDIEALPERASPMRFMRLELVAIAVSFVALALAISAGIIVARFARRLDAFFAGGQAKDLESIIAELGRRLRDAEEDFKRLRNDVARIDIMAGHPTVFEFFVGKPQ